ncbi:hypothetical protein U9M48_039697 [Paspalum notatum var. saurae]|uniref:Uncharacterized protein n=1 Tax=Paspalum notatum var. saurae TaxID=547442 RepID=A0AAQ3UP08_PASNO
MMTATGVRREPEPPARHLRRYYAVPRARTATTSPTVGTATPTPSTLGPEKLSEDPDEHDYFDSTQGFGDELDDNHFYAGRR